MVTRIIMDKTIEAPGWSYLEGEVYDSRFPHDIPTASDGIQHSIPQHRLDLFVAEGWAHEQTWQEWRGQLRKNRKAHIDACTDPVRKAQLVAADNVYSALDITQEVAGQNTVASVEPVTQGELLTIVGKLRHSYPDAKIASADLINQMFKGTRA